jgi:hypothetical protein
VQPFSIADAVSDDQCIPSACREGDVPDTDMRFIRLSKEALCYSLILFAKTVRSPNIRGMHPTSRHGGKKHAPGSFN